MYRTSGDGGGARRATNFEFVTHINNQKIKRATAYQFSSKDMRRLQQHRRSSQIAKRKSAPWYQLQTLNNAQLIWPRTRSSQNSRPRREKPEMLKINTIGAIGEKRYMGKSQEGSSITDLGFLTVSDIAQNSRIQI